MDYNPMRLAKYLARAGIASRRASDAMIRAGRVRVNGNIELLPQTFVDSKDCITVDGSPVAVQTAREYFLLNKPPGYISTVKDTHNRKTVIDLINSGGSHLYPVGRLDADTGGILLLTNDGELAYRLTHPRYMIKKIYRAWVKGIPEPGKIFLLSSGIEILGVKTAPAVVKLIKILPDQQRALLELTLTEGRKRQVKNMLAAIGCPVINLQRISFAGLTLGSLPRGAFRSLTTIEVKRLYSLVELPPE